MKRKIDEPFTVFERVLHRSRAVAVKRGVSIPLPFYFALAESEVCGREFSPAVMSAALILGFLKPRESLTSNLHPYDKINGIYVIANHLQADHYSKLLKRANVCLTKKPYESVDDVLLEIIPKLRLHNLLNPCFRADFEVFSHTASSKSAIPIPQEDCWNKQMRNLILGAGTQSSSNTGMPDFVCELNETTHVIFDNMLVKRQSDLEDHIDRFCKQVPTPTSQPRRRESKHCVV